MKTERENGRIEFSEWRFETVVSRVFDNNFREKKNNKLNFYWLFWNYENP